MTRRLENLTVALAHLEDLDALERVGLEMRGVSASTPNPSGAALRAVEAAALLVVQAVNSLPRRGGLGPVPVARLISLRVGNATTRAVVSLTISHRNSPVNQDTPTGTAGSNRRQPVDSRQEDHQALEVERAMELAEAEVAARRAEVALARAEDAAEVAEVVEVTAETWARARGRTRKRKANH
jgi:hypothetical protein